MLSKLAFIFAIPIYATLTYVAGILMWQRTEEQFLWLIVVGGTGAIVLLGLFVFIYKTWGIIQDGYVKISPLTTGILVLVPGVNILWLFHAIGMLSVRCNQYITRHDVPTRRLPVIVFFLLPLVLLGSFVYNAWLFTIPLAIGLMVIIVWTTIEAMNAIIHHQQAEAVNRTLIQ